MTNREARKRIMDLISTERNHVLVMRESGLDRDRFMRALRAASAAHESICRILSDKLPDPPRAKKSAKKKRTTR